MLNMLTHKQNVRLFILGQLDRLTPMGLAAYDQLTASGFIPNRDEVIRSLVINGDVPDNDPDGLTELANMILSGSEINPLN